jgi:hypothetical protein
LPSIATWNSRLVEAAVHVLHACRQLLRGLDHRAGGDAERAVGAARLDDRRHREIANLLARRHDHELGRGQAPYLEDALGHRLLEAQRQSQAAVAGERQPRELEHRDGVLLQRGVPADVLAQVEHDVRPEASGASQKARHVSLERRTLHPVPLLEQCGFDLFHGRKDVRLDAGLAGPVLSQPGWTVGDENASHRRDEMGRPRRRQAEMAFFNQLLAAHQQRLARPMLLHEGRRRPQIGKIDRRRSPDLDAPPPRGPTRQRHGALEPIRTTMILADGSGPVRVRKRVA